MQYRVTKIIISKKKYPGLWNVFRGHCMLSKNLRNAAMFRIRQNFTAHDKENLTNNEQEVRDEIELTIRTKDTGRPKSMLSYRFLEKLMRATENPDFFAGLPMQSAQAVLHGACDSFEGWLKSLKSYKTNPKSFTGKPKMPGYIRKDEFKTTYSNQDAVIHNKNGKTFLKLPLTKETVTLDNKYKDIHLKQVDVIPYYGDYMLIMTYEDDLYINTSDMPYIAAMDTGVDNIATIVSNSGSAGRIYKGGAIKSCNRWFNKRMSELKAIQMKGRDPKTYHPEQTKHMKQLSRYRDCFMNDHLHKVGTDIIKWLLRERCGTLVVGVNKQQKQNSGMSKHNNQNFVPIPFATLRNILKYLCERNGIVYIEREESYTSKASCIDMDYIPTYGKDDKNAKFSGKRISRGLYRSKDGIIVNADINAAGNILRKECPDAFKGLDMDFLTEQTVVRFHDLYLKRNPVRRIAAA